MRILSVLVSAVLLAAAPAFAQKVFVDYDEGYDFKNIKTFGWRETSETSVAQSSPLLHSRIVNGIEHYLSMSGITETEDQPDITVTYHTSTKQELSLNTSTFGYGYPGSWRYGGYYGGGFGSSSTTVSSYELGTLVVDAWDTATNKLVWRGVATNITVTENPHKMEKKVDKALKKIVDKWQKLKSKG